jgi:hypothetical protein
MGIQARVPLKQVVALAEGLIASRGTAESYPWNESAGQAS